jgi:translation initiation factor IF-3
VVRIKHYTINERIRPGDVRVIDADGAQLGIMSRDQALTIARDKGMDLVLVASDDKASVCKIADFGKMKYEMMKQEKEARKKQKTTTLKELKLSIKIGEHDYLVVRNKSVDFLQRGHKVKVSLRFKGREVTHPQLGAKVLQRLIDDVAEVGIAESRPKLEGKHYFMTLSPKS